MGTSEQPVIRTHSIYYLDSTPFFTCEEGFEYIRFCMPLKVVEDAIDARFSKLFHVKFSSHAADLARHHVILWKTNSRNHEI